MCSIADAIRHGPAKNFAKRFEQSRFRYGSVASKTTLMAEEQYYFEGLTPASVPPSEPPHNGKPANWDSYKGREILLLALLPEPLIVPAIKTLTNSVRQRYGFIRKP